MEKLTFEQKKARVRDFRPIDDSFFEVLAKDKEVCEEMLRTILQDKNLTVLEVTVQESFKNLYGRSVRVDALCTLGDGTLCNIEVQRSNNDDHLKRARYNASCITANVTDVGEKFKNIPTLYLVYISEFDFLKEQKTIYHINKVIEETGTIVDDGLHEIFVNTCVDDNTDIAELMHCFIQKEINSDKFPKLKQGVHYLKEDEEGVTYMCEIMTKEREAGRAEGRAEGRADSFIEMVNDGEMSPERAAQKLEMTLEEFLSQYASRLTKNM